MSLIARYVAQVGRHLPEKDRADIEAEIRSMIEDMLEERGHTAKSADDKAIAEILEQLGDPTLLAHKYSPPKRYLIGPGWYELYVTTLRRILFTALPIVAVVIFMLTLMRDPLDFLGAAGEAFGAAFNVGLHILFWVTLVFVFLERSEEVPEKASSESRAWTVAQLPETPRVRQIPIVETIIDTAAILFVMIWIALPLMLERFQGNDMPVPFLHPNLWNFWLPIFFAIMALSLVHQIFQLRIGSWTPALTATNVILGVISIVYIAALVTTQDVINPAFLAMLDSSIEMAKLREVARWSVDISAAIIAGIYVWDIVHSIRMARQLDKQEFEITTSMQGMS